MKNQLTNLRESMNNTVLKSGLMTNEEKQRILTVAIENKESSKQEKVKGSRSMKKRLIAAGIAVAVLVPTGVFAGPKLPSLVEKIVGTTEEAKQKVGMSKENYENFNKTLEVAKQILTKEEFERYNELLIEDYKWFAKISTVENGERYTDNKKFDALTSEEKQRADEVMKELHVFNEKIYGKFTYTLEEAQKLVTYPIKLPTYIPDRYTLEEKTIKAQPTVEKPKPVVLMKYTKETKLKDNNTYIQELRIVQSDIAGPGKESFVGPSPFNNKKFKFDKLSEYTLDGNTISFGQYRDGGKGMKIVVPAKAGNSAYQIYIDRTSLSKEELEKVLLSMVE